MKTLGKFLGLLLLGLLLIAVALGFALSHLFDPNDYKEDIRKLARDKAGLDLQLEGQIAWTLFPQLGLQLGDVSLASTETSDRPFARIGQLGLSVRLLPLLSGDIDMHAVRIDSLQLDLQRDAQGRGNWELGKTSTAGNGSSSAGSSDGHDRLQHVDIATLELTRSRVRYTDVASGQVLTLNELNLTTGAIREGSNIALELNSQLSASQPQLAGHLRLTGQLRADIDQRRYQLQDLDLSGSLSNTRQGSIPLEYSMRGQLQADLAAGNAEWRSLAIKANQLELSGELRARQLDQASPVLEGQLSAAPLNLRAMMSAIGAPLPELRDPATFKRVGFSTRLSASASQLNLDDLQLQLDDSHLTGKLLAARDDKGQQLSLQLQGDQLEIERYLAPEEAPAAAGTAAAPSAAASTGWSDAPLLPLDALRKLNADVSLDLQKMTLKQLPLQDFALRLKAAGGQIQLDQLQGSVDGGKLLLKGSLDARTDKPRLQLQSNMDRLPLEPLLQAANPQQPAALHGILQLETSLSAQGNSSRDLIASLDGKSSFAITEGELIGVNLEQQMCQGIALANRQSLTREFPADTALQELRGSLLIDNGVISNNDLSARIPGLNLAGKGSVDLNKRSLDYRAGLTLVGAQGADADPACKVSDKLASVSWPLRCTGALADGGKTCSIDREAVAATAVKAAGSKLVEKAAGKLQDKLKSLKR